ncbi:MAG: cytochrome c peroxidase [Myxococcota bacterium]|jgi:cytochrome c peroxidase
MARWTLVLALGLAACGSGTDLLPVPDGFPDLRIPQDNPLTAEKAELGRFLFYDTRLSNNDTQSCGSCHFQELAFTDGRTLSVGSTGQGHPRNANGLSNVGYNSTLTWANPLMTELETQALVPIFGDDPIELGANEAVLERFQNDPMYIDMFDDAFPERREPIDWDGVVDAIASFERTLLTGNSRFDKFTYQGERDALTGAELRGMLLYFSEDLECQHCHGGFNFSEATTHADQPFDAAFFNNTGLYNVDGEGAYPADNTGIFELTLDPQDMGRFRAPSLRNIAVTAPYMHDGSVETLEEVIRNYERGGRLIEDGPDAGDGSLSPLKSGFIAGFTLADDERDDLLAFLQTLTDETFLTDERFSDPFENR